MQLRPGICRSNMVVSWSKLLLLLVGVALIYTPADFVQMQSDGAAGYYSIEIGEITLNAAEARAVAKLSCGPDQEAWWQLADVPWHDSALERFLLTGPLEAKEMEALAAKNGSTDACNACKINVDDVKLPPNLIQVLQNISTIAYRQNLSTAGTGVIEASIWTAMFKCASGRSCNQGYLAPIVIVRPNASTLDLSYATLWLPATTNMLLNAIPSFIISSLPPPIPVAPPPAAGAATSHDLPYLVNVRDGVPSCPSNTLFENYRTVLDGSYGLVPGSACLKFVMGEQDHESFRVLVSLSVSSKNNTDSAASDYVEDIQGLLSRILQVSRSEWVTLPFEECSGEAVLRFDADLPDYLRICHQKICVVTFSVCVVTFSGINMSCSLGSDNPAAHGMQHLKTLIDITKLEPTCTHKGKPLNTVGSEVFKRPKIKILCTNIVISAKEMSCAATVKVAREDDDSRIPVVSPRSKWAYTNGENTEEFSQAPKQILNVGPCAMKVSFPSTISPMETTQMIPPKTVQIRARAYLTSYIAGHNIAFTMAKGPATGLRTFVALLLSTAVSVTIAIPWPFTSFLLKMICRSRPFLFHPRRGSMRKLAKVFWQVMCNVLLSGVSFLPVLAIAWDELEREHPFYTWDLRSTDLVFHDTNRTHVRILCLLSAKSKYESHFVSSITVVVCSTCIIVAGCTVWRCLQIFKRYARLQELADDHDTQQQAAADLGGAVPKYEDQRAAAMQRAIRAIEMTDAEYLEISNLPLHVERQCRIAPAGRRLLAKRPRISHNKSLPIAMSASRVTTSTHYRPAHSLPITRTSTRSSAAADHQSHSARRADEPQTNTPPLPGNALNIDSHAQLPSATIDALKISR